MNNEDYLAHHGVKGMKWGIRRYQNYDGTMTEVGKKRLKALSTISEDHSELTQKVKKISDTTNDFLAGYVTMVEQKNGKEARIAPIEVHENYRGRGLSSELLERANKGYDKTNLSVYVDNKVARKLYDNHGYKRKDTKFYKDGTAFDVMERDNTKRRRP